MDEEKQVVIEEESRGLTFKDILFIIRKHWIAIVAFIVTATAGGFIWSKVEPPTYKSTGTIMVSYESGSATATYNDYNFSNNLTKTVAEFVTKNVVLEPVSKELNINKDVIAKNLTVTNNTGNLLVTVSYTSSDATKAKDVVNAVMNKTIELSLSKEGEGENAKPTYHMFYNNLDIIDPAEDGKRVSHTLRDTAIGLGAGVVLAFLFVLIWELSDNTFKSTEEIERILNIPVLAGIPDYHFDDEKKGGK